MEGTLERTDLILAGGLVILAGATLVPGCTSTSAIASRSCTNGVRDGNETGVDCGGSCPAACGTGTDPQRAADGGIDPGGVAPRSRDSVKNDNETDIDCGGASAPKCAEGKSCLVDGDCDGACNYAQKCVAGPSCKPHLGGDTCGKGEVNTTGAVHESCCRTLPVPGYTDPRQPGKTVYLDKYEITAGRVRAFVNSISAEYGGKANIREWIVTHTPSIWDPAWNKFLPTDNDAETVRVSRLLLGDRRSVPEAAPVPDFDQDLKVGIDYQFNAQLFVYLHGNNCSTHLGAFGFPTWFYPAEVLAKQGPETFPPRSAGENLLGALVPASEHLEVKAMNCITNAMLTAFCAWDGGQLATDEVLDFVTDSPESLGNAPGCGSQIGTEDPPATTAATEGGRCAPLLLVNATFDAGGDLPVPGSPLNFNNYDFPVFAKSVTHDKAWEISAPGRGSRAANGEQVDAVRINPGDEPWMDLAGNLNEAVLDMSGATFTGNFGLKLRGIGYQSSRSELNVDSTWEGEGGLQRIQRPEARAGFAGGRCMRFK
jgi:hypothetical protein